MPACLRCGRTAAALRRSGSRSAQGPHPWVVVHAEATRDIGFRLTDAAARDLHDAALADPASAHAA